MKKIINKKLTGAFIALGLSINLSSSEQVLIQNEPLKKTKVIQQPEKPIIALPILSKKEIKQNIKIVIKAIAKMRTARNLLITDFVAKSSIAAIPLAALITIYGISFNIFKALNYSRRSITFEKFVSENIQSIKNIFTKPTEEFSLKTWWTNTCHIIAISAFRKKALSYFLLLPGTHLAITQLKIVPTAIAAINELKKTQLSNKENKIITLFNRLLENDPSIKGLSLGAIEVRSFDDFAQSILNKYSLLAKELGKNGIKNTKKWLWTNYELNNLQNAYDSAEKIAWKEWEKKNEAALAKGKTLKKPTKINFSEKRKYAIKIKSQEKIINNLNKKYPAFETIAKDIITSFIKHIEDGRLEKKAI